MATPAPATPVAGASRHGAPEEDATEERVTTPAPGIVSTLQLIPWVARGLGPRRRRLVGKQFAAHYQLRGELSRAAALEREHTSQVLL